MNKLTDEEIRAIINELLGRYTELDEEAYETYTTRVKNRLERMEKYEDEQ